MDDNTDTTTRYYEDEDGYRKMIDMKIAIYEMSDQKPINVLLHAMSEVFGETIAHYGLPFDQIMKFASDVARNAMVGHSPDCLKGGTTH